jgi:hypothetical protein
MCDYKKSISCKTDMNGAMSCNEEAWPTEPQSMRFDFLNNVVVLNGPELPMFSTYRATDLMGPFVQEFFINGIRNFLSVHIFRREPAREWTATTHYVNAGPPGPDVDLRLYSCR